MLATVVFTDIVNSTAKASGASATTTGEACSMSMTGWYGKNSIAIGARRSRPPAMASSPCSMARPGRPVRPRHRRGRASTRYRCPRWPPSESAKPEATTVRHRCTHRCPRRCTGRPRRGAHDHHRAGPRGRIGSAVRGPRDTAAQRRTRPLESTGRDRRRKWPVEARGRCRWACGIADRARKQQHGPRATPKLRAVPLLGSAMR